MTTVPSRGRREVFHQHSSRGFPMYLTPVYTVLIFHFMITLSSVAAGPLQIPGGIMNPLHCKKRHSRRER